MKLILNGGGVGDAVSNARAKLNDLIEHNKKILYIPFAWPDSSYTGCFEFMSNELSDVDTIGLEMVKNVEELNSKNFDDYAFIYIGGGNTFKLLKMLKISGNFEKIAEYLKKDGIVYGGSAGAIIFGKDLDSCRTDDLNEVELEDIRGFNLINGYSLLCHYTNRDYERTKKSTEYLLELSKIKPIIAIPEEDTIFINDDSIEIFGSKPYYIFKGGIMTKYQINSNKGNCEFNK